MEKDVELRKQPGCWLRSSHSFKECVIAHWSSDDAPKMSGAKTRHRSYGFAVKRAVEEHSVLAEAVSRDAVDGTVERMPV